MAAFLPKTNLKSSNSTQQDCWAALRWSFFSALDEIWSQVWKWKCLEHGRTWSTKARRWRPLSGTGNHRCPMPSSVFHPQSSGLPRCRLFKFRCWRKRVPDSENNPLGGSWYHCIRDWGESRRNSVSRKSRKLERLSVRERLYPIPKGQHWWNVRQNECDKKSSRA